MNFFNPLQMLIYVRPNYEHVQAQHWPYPIINLHVEIDQLKHSIISVFIF